MGQSAQPASTRLFIFYETAAVDFFGKDGKVAKEGLLLAPAYAVPRGVGTRWLNAARFRLL